MSPLPPNGSPANDAGEQQLPLPLFVLMRAAEQAALLAELAEMVGVPLGGPLKIQTAHFEVELRARPIVIAGPGDLPRGPLVHG